MPFTSDQLTIGANYALETRARIEPIDQINQDHPTLAWLIANSEESSFGNGIHKEPLFIDNGSNAQNYHGADQVTFNQRDPNRWTTWQYYSMHDGFWFDEDRLIAAGIHLSDDPEAAPTATEKEALLNLLKQSYRALKEGKQQALAFEMFRDGTQNAKATPGFESLISATPAAGTIGGIAASNAYWQNNTNLGIVTTTAGTLINEWEETWRACMRYGRMKPDFIPVGAALYDAFRNDANTRISRSINDGGSLKGGITIDPATNNLFFHGTPVVWDPDLDALDTLLGTTTRTKTGYFLNSKVTRLVKVKREWMRNRKPEKLPDRYVHYFGRTSKYSLITGKRNATAVTTIA